MRSFLLWWAALVISAAAARAHFPFLIPEPGGASARLVMSETLSPDPDVGIEILSGIKLWMRDRDGKETPLTAAAKANFMAVELPGQETRVVRGLADLGVMSRGKPHVLVYHPKTILGDPFATSTVVGGSVPVELIPVRADKGFRLKLVAGGKPVADKEVRVLTPDGEEEDYPTDAHGLTPVFTESGRYGAWARHWVDESGERGGKTYEQVRHYATLVFDADARADASLPPLPQAVASFGAIECDGWVYVYGGHKSRRHDYSTESVSGRLYRLDLRAPTAWQELSPGIPTQGMNLAAINGKVYRAGGMEPRNAPEDPADNFSIAAAAEFDPATGAWRDLPPLPHPRSSHDLIAVDGKLFAIGGWWMKGKDAETQWLETMEVFDPANPSAGWRSIPQPFTRRALAAAVAGTRIVVCGGFDADENAQLDVDIYDTVSGVWSKGPQVPGPSRNGFAPAACSRDGAVYLSVGTGEMYRLSADASSWIPVAKSTPRIVHRLVPFQDRILVLGGASASKMVDTIEAVTPNP